NALFDRVASSPTLGDRALGVLSGLDTTSSDGPGSGPIGTGALGTGIMEDLRGGAGFNTIGLHGPNRPRPGFARGKGTLRPRTRDPTAATAGPIISHGQLDKEIVRRVIRQHLNEVKYCYEQELVRTPTLAGRLLVGFTIAADGRVLAAVTETAIGDV